MQLEADGAGLDLLAQRLRQAGIALAEKSEVHGKRFRRLQHTVYVPGAGCTRGGLGAGGRPGAAAEHGGDARHQGLLDLLRADEVYVGVDATGGNDQALAGDDLGGGTDDYRHRRLDVRIAGLAYGLYAPMLDADVGLDDAPMIDNECIGDDGVGDLRRGALALAHAVAYHLAAAELDFFAIDAEILFHFQPQSGIRQAHAVAGGGSKHLGIGGAGDGACHGLRIRPQAARFSLSLWERVARRAG